MRMSLLPLLCAGLVFAQDEYVPPSQEIIEGELNSAEEDFAIAQKMFVPWYSGPLITGSASNVDPGLILLQPYFFTTVTHASYDDNRHSKNIPNILTLNPLYYYETGITSWLDTFGTYSAIFNRQSNIWASYSADSSIGFGLQIQRETPYIPKMRFTFSESLPTGKYDNLDAAKNGLDSTGSGSYETTISFNISKVLWWNKLHPSAVRGNFIYTFTTPTHVDNLNAYGGGPGTDGKVKPGNSWGIDIGYEYSITQKWVFACDAVYTYFNKSSFSGNKGRDANGIPFSVGGPSGDQLSFAPALEYNLTPDMGMVAGVWFTATGRNSGNFISLVYTFYTVF